MLSATAPEFEPKGMTGDDVDELLSEEELIRRVCDEAAWTATNSNGPPPTAVPLPGTDGPEHHGGFTFSGEEGDAEYYMNSQTHVAHHMHHNQHHHHHLGDEFGFQGGGKGRPVPPAPSNSSPPPSARFQGEGGYFPPGGYKGTKGVGLSGYKGKGGKGHHKGSSFKGGKSAKGGKKGFLHHQQQQQQVISDGMTAEPLSAAPPPPPPLSPAPTAAHPPSHHVHYPWYCAVVEEIVDFFRHQYLLPMPQTPKSQQAMHDCVADFRRFVHYAAASWQEHGPLDLDTFEQLCSRFSSEWRGTSRWLDPKVLSQVLGGKLQIVWK